MTNFIRLVAPCKRYRKAILQALEESRDFQSRSNLDSIRRHTLAILEDQDFEKFKWNDVIFLRTMKSIVNDGDIDLCSNILAELSPSFKRKRADSLSQRMAVELEPVPLIQNQTVDTSTNDYNTGTNRHSPKQAPHRPVEHDKWKIIPKNLYDKAEFE
jgi:hypothetical protein